MKPNYSRRTSKRIYKSVIKTYISENVVSKRTVYFDAPHLESHEIPVVVHSNQTLEYIF